MVLFGALIRDRSLSSANNIPEVRDKLNLRIDQILGVAGTILLYDTAISYKKGSSVTKFSNVLSLCYPLQVPC